MSILRLLGLGALAVLVSSCSYVDVNDVRGLDPQGSDFNKGLFKEYVDLADFEVGEYDWNDASKYAAKAQVAASGEDVQPYDPAMWDIDDATALADLQDARVRLLSALDAGGRDKAPADAAHAQAMYDCWVEQQEEGWQIDHINKCRGEFELALANVLKALQPMEAMAEPEPEAEQVSPSKFIIYFGFDVADVAESAMGVIAEIAGMASSQGPSKITVQGHADRAGSDDYNLALSAKRAANVAAALEANGVAAGSMEVSEFGESVPLVPTDDGVRNPENRRVEIEFIQ